MRLRLELQIGPLFISLDPWPEDEDDEPEQPDSITAYSQAERSEDYTIPELHVGFRANGD